MFGVFFMSEMIRVEGLKDLSIHVFDTEADAKGFIFDKLVEAGEIEVDGAEFLVDETRFGSREEAVEAVQDSFGMTEYFHCYAAFDHRKAAGA
jgi:hypothetical protein